MTIQIQTDDVNEGTMEGAGPSAATNEISAGRPLSPPRSATIWLGEVTIGPGETRRVEVDLDHGEDLELIRIWIPDRCACAIGVLDVLLCGVSCWMEATESGASFKIQTLVGRWPPGVPSPVPLVVSMVNLSAESITFCPALDGRWLGSTWLCAPVVEPDQGVVVHHLAGVVASLRAQVHHLRVENATLREGNLELERRITSLMADGNRLRALINSPQIDDFFEAVRVESAHQVERWGTEHDAGKRPEDWVTLVVYLMGKASRAHFDGNGDKLLHHVITLAAVALNWHRNLTGESRAMRPGVGTGKDAVGDPVITGGVPQGAASRLHEEEDRAISRARALLAGGVSPPIRADTTVMLARAVLEMDQDRSAGTFNRDVVDLAHAILSHAILPDPSGEDATIRLAQAVVAMADRRTMWGPRASRVGRSDGNRE